MQNREEGNENTDKEHICSLEPYFAMEVFGYLVVFEGGQGQTVFRVPSCENLSTQVPIICIIRDMKPFKS